MAKLAVLLCEGSSAREHLCLARILDFFGVPWKAVEWSKLSDAGECVEGQALFGSAQTVAAALKRPQNENRLVPRPAAFYVYPCGDHDANERGLRYLCGVPDVSLREAPAGTLLLKVSRELADAAGPMAGLEVTLRLRREDAVLAGMPSEESGFETIISVGGAPVFFRFQHCGMPIFFSTSSQIIDIDQSVGAGFYDVKGHFCSAVPLVMFIRLMFPDVAWRPQELGACLIIDDPLLRKRYGSCDFGMLRNLMQKHDFTTNIAFIPWNWRRTSSAASEFFKNEAGRFSVSIHGCDHIGAEFGETSLIVLNNRAKLAQSRMRNHEARTGIHHDPVMVFPQGVFSSVCPEILKRNCYLAAVNTETTPADSPSIGTRITDVWDVAIMRYGSFPVFTRRYAHHGLENFAFDLLLGKPCFIVSHHDFFKNGCAELIELIEKLQSLNCSLHWRTLGGVIRRACRRRANGVGAEEVEMYGTELLIQNHLDQAISVRIRKRETEPSLVTEVRCDRQPIMWTTKEGELAFEDSIGPRNERLLQVLYREQGGTEIANRSLRFELSVAVRRVLSEVRDDYLSRSLFLSNAAASLKDSIMKSD